MATFELLSLVLFLGLVFKASGFLVRDELLLRFLVLVGLSCDILFYALQPVPIWQSVIANALLVAINFTLVMFIVFERTTIALSAQDKALFRHFPTLLPGQFRRLLRHATRHRTTAPARIVSEGAELDRLYFVDGPRFDIEKRGRRFAADGPAFVGELVFLGAGKSSASVDLPEGTDYVAFDSAALHRAMKRSPGLSNAMIALFGSDLAKKVANSVPIAEAPEVVPEGPVLEVAQWPAR